MVLHAVAGGRSPTVSPPWKHRFAPPPRRIGIWTPVTNCAVVASIPVLSAKLVFSNGAVCTPLTVCTVPTCARHDPGGQDETTTSELIVTGIPAEVVVFPAASRAVAVSVWAPLALPRESHGSVYFVGVRSVVVAAPRSWPSS